MWALAFERALTLESEPMLDSESGLTLERQTPLRLKTDSETHQRCTLLAQRN